MIDSNLLDILSCPHCKSLLQFKQKRLFCTNKNCKKHFDIISSVPIFSPSANKYERDMNITINKWEKIFKNTEINYDPDNPSKDILISSKYANKFFGLSNVTTDKVFLEAGCGTARTALEIAKNKNLTIICLDISLQALLKAKALFKKNNRQGYFIQGDLRALPLKKESVDFIFSDGAIEHFKETKKAVGEFYRILHNKGRVFATVPYACLGMMTYGQLQGNIPNIFPIKNLLEFFHINLTKGKFLKHGYELSFTKQQMKKLFKEFNDVNIGHFNTYNEIRFIRNECLKKLLRKVSDFKQFWPLIYVYGEKIV